MSLPMAEIGKVMFGARRAEVARLALVYGVGWVVWVKRARVGDAFVVGKRARLAAQCAGANQIIGIDVAIGGNEKRFGKWGIHGKTATV